MFNVFILAVDVIGPKSTCNGLIKSSDASMIWIMLWVYLGVTVHKLWSVLRVHIPDDPTAMSGSTAIGDQSSL